VPLRQAVVTALAGQPPGTTTDAEHLSAYLDWHRPRRASHARDIAVAAILREAATLGLTGAGALASFGAAVFRGDSDPAVLLAEHIPAAVDHIIVQADLTALAPGRLLPEPARLMTLVADVESTGVATNYRFTEDSIRRALDQGHSAAELIDFLTQLSRTPLPQPLTYLIADVARKHGSLRVGTASVFLRCDDVDLLHQVAADRKLSSLRLRMLAPGVVISPIAAEVVLERLRQAGYAPMAESADGTLMIQRTQPRRTISHTTTAQVTAATPSPRLIHAAVQALLNADIAPATTAGPGPRQATSTTVALLREAVASSRALWIGYADKSGVAREYTVEPLTLTAGFLTAFDTTSSEVRTYTISRITGAQYAGADEEGAAS
jgi:hypothetical protein